MPKIILIIVLFIIVAGLFVYKNFIYENIDLQKPENNGGSQIFKVGKDAIYVADQKQGSSVVIDLVSVSRKSYVVIHEDIQGEPGNIIGNSKIISEGESKNTAIGLVRPVSHGESLFAMLHEDSGDGIFTPNLDVPLRDGDGNIIFMRFYIDQGASEPADVSL